MWKIICIAVVVFLCVPYLGYAQRWTEESARQEAFRDVKYHIDVSPYATVDPDFQENQQALKAGIEEVDGRFITKNDELSGYLVSKLDKRRRPLITMFYRDDGRLMYIRLFSGMEYPRVAYIYCVEDNCRDGDKIYQPGELRSISLRVSEREEFYFLPDGKFTGRFEF